MIRTFTLAAGLALAATAVAHTPSGTGDKSAAVAPYQKPGLSLRMTHADLKPVSPGETAHVRVRFPDVPKGGTLRVAVSSSTGLDISGPQLFTVPAGATDTVLDIPVSAELQGRHYLDVRAMVDGQDGMRALSVPVQVGAGGVIGKVTPGDVVTRADGRALMVMDAEETINGERVGE